MKNELYNYDIFPKVLRVRRPVTITIRPQGLQSAFPAEVVVHVCPLEERAYPQDDTPLHYQEYRLSPEADGCLRVCHTFETEQEYYLTVTSDEKVLCKLAVYAIEDDLAGLVPLMGDQHLHTIRSDGREDPAIVAAHLRSEGYDYIAITDHRNFSGALECMDAYRDVPLDMHLMTGEEVHLPDCFLHCVHIGGRYSINAMVESLYAMLEEVNPGCTALHPEAWTQMEGSDFPGTMTDAEFQRVIEAYAATLEPIPEGVPRFVYAGFCWICDQIRKAGGLSIFPHPYWIHTHKDMPYRWAFHGNEKLTQHLFDTKPFDAFEVLGGENYFEHNGFQTVHYYEALAKGCRFPIVGSSDSHSSVNNRNAFIARTIAFARENSTPAILEAIRAGHTVAVDAISTEWRLVGDFRLVKYAWFLVDNYFPLHQRACFEQGRAMKEYYCGDREEGRAALEFLHGRNEKLWRKYFDFT